MAETSLVAALRQSADPKAVDEIEQLIEHGADRDLNRINVLAFAAKHGLNTQEVIAAFLKAARSRTCKQEGRYRPDCAHSRRSRCLMLRLKRDVRSGSGLRLLEALLELPQGGGV